MTATIARKPFPNHAIENLSLPPRDEGQSVLEWLAPVLQAGGYVVDEELHFHNREVIEAAETVAFSGCTFIWHGKEPPLKAFRGPISMVYCTIDTSDCDPRWSDRLSVGVALGKTEAWQGVNTPASVAGGE